MEWVVIFFLVLFHPNKANSDASIETAENLKKKKGG
jgi:hypothetical protein